MRELALKMESSSVELFWKNHGLWASCLVGDREQGGSCLVGDSEQDEEDNEDKELQPDEEAVEEFLLMTLQRS